TLFGLVWGLALAGIALKVVGRMQHPILSTCLYIAMGWLLIIGGKQVWLRVPAWGLFWLLAGGIAYTAGVAFFAADRIRYGHLVWHLFVIAGTACHFIAVLWYAGHEGDVLPGGQMRKEAAVLEHVAHSPPEHHGVGTGQLGALEADEAGVRLGLDPSEDTG
ncbi:MAG: hemolysin III family protein, partial [Planctomycetota bacterium]